MVLVRAFDKDIGQLVEDKGIVKFKYLETNTLDFSPIKMPIKSPNIYNFSKIQHQDGLPGLISDHLPGSYGMDYMDKFIYEQLKRTPTVMERLQFLGSHTLGALEFHPVRYKSDGYKEILNVSQLYAESKKILDEDHKYHHNSQATLKTLIAISNSAGGGARAKAMVGFNPEDKSISLTRKQGDFPKGYFPAIIKYDDQNISMYPTLGNKYKKASIPTKLEYLYHMFAKKAGIAMSPCELIEYEDRSHFMTYRFDRRGGKRFHMHSLSGMMHYNPRETYNDYMSMFKIAQKLNLSQTNKEQIAKLLIFNAIFGNRDDHSKNFSFLMNSEGKWAFAPAYDLTYTSNGYHQMLLGSSVLNRTPFEKLRDTFAPYNISEVFLKENIQHMIDIKQTELIKESVNHGIPKRFISEILEQTKQVDEHFTTGA